MPMDLQPIESARNARAASKLHQADSGGKVSQAMVSRALCLGQERLQQVERGARHALRPGRVRC